MPSWRKCVFGCQDDYTLFSLPKDNETRQKWLDFIFGNNPPTKSNYFLCSCHFTYDSFFNKSLFETGLVSQLRLKNDAIPTLKKTSSETTPAQPAIEKPTTQSTSNPTRACTPTTRSVSTQLSVGTLKTQHHRSKGVQATVNMTSRGTSTEGTMLQFSSTPLKSSEVGQRPLKRPRTELDQESEDDCSMSFPVDQDSTYQPGDTTTDLSDVIETESPTELEDAKYIVFESALKELFENCPVCKEHCVVVQRRCGTFVAFNQDCPHCLYSRKWQSQPMNGKIPQGNLELSAAVYFNGGSFQKFTRICNTVNLKLHDYTTFRRHARQFLEPAIYYKWKTDQSKLLEEMKAKSGISVSGDMRANSPGHSAKFGSYTIMENEDEKVLDIQLVQSNEVGSSVNMEKEGLKRSLDFLESNSVQLRDIVTDRHPQVQKYLRERQICHYYDVWHVVKGLSKKLEALAKKKDCELIKKWLPGIKNHMYWTAGSSSSGAEKVAKWTSLLNHIQDVHEHDNPLFQKCLHPIKTTTDRKKWFKPGTMALYKVEKVLLNKRILKDVHKLSSKHQTSALESFHSLIPRFAPKNVSFPFIGMLCRLYLAAMHHNENGKRDQALSKGRHARKILFPKSTKGRATARPVKTHATFGYRSNLMNLLFKEVLCDPKKFQDQLQMVTVPPTLSSDFEKTTKEEVVAAQYSRFNPAGPETGRAGIPHSSHQDPETPAESSGPHTTG